MPRVDALPPEFQRAFTEYHQAWAASPVDLRFTEVTSESDPDIEFQLWLTQVLALKLRPRPLELALYAVSRGREATQLPSYRFGGHDGSPG